MKKTPTKEKWTFVADSKVVSRPGAAITVTELILTDQGRQAITSGSKGITEGTVKILGPVKPGHRALEPA